MSGDECERRNLSPMRRGMMPAPVEPRTVAIHVGDTIYTPALPAAANDAAALRGCIDAHLGAVLAMDRFHAAAVAFAARRSVIRKPAAEIDAELDEQEELKHQRILARKRRERELLQEDLETAQVKDKLTANEELRPHKIGLGASRFEEKIAQHRAGQAVARASIGEEILEPEPKPAEKPKSASTAETLALLADDLEKQIDEAEAAGRATDQLHGELKSVNALLRRELLKSAGR